MNEHLELILSKFNLEKYGNYISLYWITISLSCLKFRVDSILVKYLPQNKFITAFLLYKSLSELQTYCHSAKYWECFRIYLREEPFLYKIFRVLFGNLALAQVYFDKESILHALTNLLFCSIVKSYPETGTLKEREYNEISGGLFWPYCKI